MSNQTFMAGKNNASEPRPAIAGEALYAQLAMKQRTLMACGRICAAMEEITLTKAEAGVILTSLKLVHATRVQPGLEDRFESPDPNDMSFFDRNAEGNHSNAANMDEDVVDKVSRVAENIFNRVTKAIGDDLVKVKGLMEDFYDARVRWYGDLVKQVATLTADEQRLDGAPFSNTSIVSALAGRPANATYDTPTARLNEVSGQTLKVMLLSEEIKAECAGVARSMSSNRASLSSAVSRLIQKIRTSSEQQGETLIWNYPSFSSVVTCKMPRGVDFESIVPEDYDPSTIKVEEGKIPAVPPTLQRATSSDLRTAQQYARGGKVALENAIQKNDKDILASLANLTESEEGLTQSQINGVKSLLIFANRIHENLAMTAQQSYYNAVYLAVYWIHTSIRDNTRSASREASAQAQ